jgi:hypothetical protein
VYYSYTNKVGPTDTITSVGCASCLTAIDWFSHGWDQRSGCTKRLTDRLGPISQIMFTEVALLLLNWMCRVRNKIGTAYVYHALAQLVPGMCYKPEGRGFDSRWCNWNF